MNPTDDKMKQILERIRQHNLSLGLDLPPIVVEICDDDEPSALDELLHEPQRDDTLDDRHWAIGAGGR